MRIHISSLKNLGLSRLNRKSETAVYESMLPRQPLRFLRPNIYTHVIGDENQKAVINLERLLFPGVPNFEESRNSRELVN